MVTTNGPHVVATVVFGRRPPAAVDVGAVGRGGFRVEVPGRQFARIAASATSTATDATTSSSWPATTACGGPRSIRIEGPAARSDLGYAVGSAGDLDGDGHGDVFVSAPGEQTPGADFGGGAVYLVYGRKHVRRIDLATDPRVVRIGAGRDLGDTIGFSVAAPADLTGDGANDVVLGGFQSGDARVVWPRTP
jgi:hypothetical protein